MGVTYIPGPEQILNPAFTQIAAGLQKFIQPNRQLEEAMQQAFAMNPELLQRFADLEKQAPGTAKALGLGRLSDLINYVPQSAEAEVKQAVRPRAAESAKAAQSAQIAKDTFTADDMEGFRKFLKENPNATVDMYRKRATGATGVEQQTQEIELAGKKIQLNEATRTEELISHLPPVEGLQMNKDANLLMSDPSKVDPTRIASYMANPIYAKTFSALLGQRQQIIENRQRQQGLNISARNAATAEQNANQRGGTTDTFMRNQAQEAYEKSGYSGTLDSWKMLLYDKDAQKKASDFLAGTIKPTTVEDYALLDAAQYQKAAEDYKVMTNAIKVNSAVSKAVSDVEASNSDGERAIKMQGLNSLLNQRAKLGGPKLKAEWESRWFGADRITFKDATGKKIEPDKIGEMLADPEATDIMQSQEPGNISGAAKSIVNQIKVTKNPREQLAALKIQDSSPGKAVSREVELELRKQGIIK